MLEYCNAGHENPYVVGGGATRIDRLDGAGGPPLCAVDGFRYASATHAMRPWEMLCIVTDGVTEAHNPTRELYGSARLQKALMRAAVDQQASTVVEDVRHDVEVFADGAEPNDDVTILVLRWKGPAPHSQNESK